MPCSGSPIAYRHTALKAQERRGYGKAGNGARDCRRSRKLASLLLKTGLALLWPAPHWLRLGGASARWWASLLAGYVGVKRDLIKNKMMFYAAPQRHGVHRGTRLAFSTLSRIPALPLLSIFLNPLIPCSATNAVLGGGDKDDCKARRGKVRQGETLTP